MKSKYKCLLILLLFSFNSKSQESSISKTNLLLEINSFYSEVQLKPYLFDKSRFSENHELGIGVEGLIGVLFKKKWLVQIGLQYAKSNYKFSKQLDLVHTNPEEIDDISNQFQFILDNSFGQLETNINMEVNQSNCFIEGTTQTIKDGDIYTANIGSWNTINTIGIPIKFGRILGKHKVKGYASINLTPKFIISKKLDFDEKFSAGVNINDNKNKHCWTQNGEVITRLDFSADISQTQWNIIDNRIDLIGEFGILHQMGSSQLRLGFFYGESITPFTRINNKALNVQLFGMKIGVILI